jgi:hypothetical protein
MMRLSTLLFRAALLGGLVIGGLAPANASIITDNFTFSGYLGEFNYGPGPTATIATGSFSYSSSLPAGQLTYSDLSSFSITVLGVAYNLPFVMGSSTGDYSYFGWNTASDSWVPANVSGDQGTSAGILAATQLDGSLSSGFFFDPLVSQSSLGSNDGLVEEYSNQAFGTVTSISTTPLPSTWPMLISGLLGIAFLAYRRSKKQVAPPVAA